MANNTKKTEIEIVIDATNCILGRIAAIAAKQSLLGKKVVIVNCDFALVTGRRRMVLDEYGIARRRGGTSLNGPHFPKHTVKIMKRTVRGMLSYNQQRGLDALKRVMCYSTVPKEYESAKKITVLKDIKSKTVTLADLGKEI
jgi:large subunit ribosomal protein L13